MMITNDLVETFLKCSTKCFLRSCGEVGTGSAHAAWVRTRNDGFRIEGTKRLVAGGAPDKYAIRTQAMERRKPAPWYLGIDFTVQRPSQIVHFSKPRWCSLEQQQRRARDQS